MEKQDVVSRFLTEYSIEIMTSSVSLDDLLSCGITEETLCLESDMRQKYGDKFYSIDGVTDDVSESKKKIEKITDRDLNLSKGLANRNEQIENDSFNLELEKLLLKVRS